MAENEIRVRSLEEAELLLIALEYRVRLLERELRDHAQRFDTLQTPLWKRLWFRIDGWPGIRNLNAEGRAWRPWH
jgi:hypothetical protein